MALYIDVHALQTLPPSNINRDDTGAPKTATFGGVPRQRVSSQAWKRAIRRDLQKDLAPGELGIRTKRVVSKIAEAIREIDDSWESTAAENAAEEVLKTAGLKIEKPKPKKDSEEPQRTAGETGYLLFLSNHQIQRVAEAIVQARGEKLKKNEAKELLDQEHSVDIAMFGRMVADAADFNVDAAVQVAHALGVDAAEPEFDYFTAVDDVAQDAEETGAGMIGTVEMMSSTLYRYATVNVAGLQRNLNSAEATVKAAVAFIRAFITSMPTGKQNTFANRTLPDLVVVSVREDRPVSWVNAFESAVEAEGTAGRRVAAAERLAAEAQSIDALYDSRPVACWVMALSSLAPAVEGLGTSATQGQLLDGLRELLQNSVQEKA